MLSLLITKMCLNNIIKRLNLELFHLSTEYLLLTVLICTPSLQCQQENRLIEKKLNCIYDEPRPTQLEHATYFKNLKYKKFTYKKFTIISLKVLDANHN